VKKILVKNAAKLKTIIAMAAFGAAALAVNTSLADNGMAWACKIIICRHRYRRQSG
jgi:hypothetical protein